MADTKQIRTLYETYIETVETLERNRKLGEGILGLKGGPAQDPCHDRFLDDLTQAVEVFAAQEPSASELTEMLSYMFTVPQAHRELRSAYWMLIAVQGLSLDLIGGLDPSDAAALRKSYGKTYPRWDRLPVQNKVLSALKAQSNERT